MPNRTNLICFFVVVILTASVACRTARKTDLRTLAPVDALIYFETRDLANALEPLTENAAFRELAADEPDFSAYKNVQFAVVILGFKSSEKQISDENSVLNFKPQFVAVAETNLWSWQAVSLVENRLDRFVRKNFGAAVRLEKTDRSGGIFFTWTASDEREFFAFVQDGMIYFGNDAAALEKCLSVRRGEADGLLKNESFARARSENNLAFGYVSPAGVAEIARLAGVSFAAKTVEDADGRNFLARLLPQVLKNTTKEVLWTAKKSERGIEDDFEISLTSEAASEVKEISAPTSVSQNGTAEFLPPDFYSATRYNLKNPALAWRGLLSAIVKNTDALSGKLLIRFSGELLEPYGISNAEDFLSSIDSEIITAQFDPDAAQSVIIVSMADAEKLKNSITKEINFKKPPENRADAEIWFSADEHTAAAFSENQLILGDGESVLKCLEAKQSGSNFTKSPKFSRFAVVQAIAATIGRDDDSAEKITAILAEKKDENRKLATFYSTETRLSENGIERRTVSDFGLIGTILKQILN